METFTADPPPVDAQCAPAASPLLQSTPLATISPELALVDPELAAEARRRLPQAFDAWKPSDERSETTVRRIEPAPVPTGAAPAAAHERRRSRALGRDRIALVGVTGVLALSALFGPLVVTAVSHGVAPGSAGATAPAPTRAPTAHGYDIRWSPVPGASYYNLVFQVQGERALDLWPREAKAHIPAGSLAPGSYTWFVYPALGSGARPAYGPVAAQGALAVATTGPEFGGS